MTSPDRMPWHSVFLRGSVTARFDFSPTPERREQVGPPLRYRDVCMHKYCVQFVWVVPHSPVSCPCCYCFPIPFEALATGTRNDVSG